MAEKRKGETSDKTRHIIGSKLRSDSRTGSRADIRDSKKPVENGKKKAEPKSGDEDEIKDTKKHKPGKKIVHSSKVVTFARSGRGSKSASKRDSGKKIEAEVSYQQAKTQTPSFHNIDLPLPSPQHNTAKSTITPIDPTLNDNPSSPINTYETVRGTETPPTQSAFSIKDAPILPPKFESISKMNFSNSIKVNRSIMNGTPFKPQKSYVITSFAHTEPENFDMIQEKSSPGKRWTTSEGVEGKANSTPFFTKPKIEMPQHDYDLELPDLLKQPSFKYLKERESRGVISSPPSQPALERHEAIIPESPSHTQNKSEWNILGGSLQPVDVSHVQLAITSKQSQPPPTNH